MIYGNFCSIYPNRAEKQITNKKSIGITTQIEDIKIRLATKEDHIFAKSITDEMHDSALIRGCGISRRSPESVIEKMGNGKAIIALTSNNEWAGFSYIETYDNNGFVSNSGLIVAPAYRKCGVAKAIKQEIFNLSRMLYPNAKIFSITTGSAVMKMNTRLGFEAVTYSEITQEKRFWEGCKSCVNYKTLQNKANKNCFCTAMLFSPEQEEPVEEENESESEHRSRF